MGFQNLPRTPIKWGCGVLGSLGKSHIHILKTYLLQQCSLQWSVEWRYYLWWCYEVIKVCQLEGSTETSHFRFHSHSRRAHPEDDVTGGRLRIRITFDFVWAYQRVRDRQLTALAAGCAAQSSWRLLTVWTSTLVRSGKYCHSCRSFTEAKYNFLGVEHGKAAATDTSKQPPTRRTSCTFSQCP